MTQTWTQHTAGPARRRGLLALAGAMLIAGCEPFTQTAPPAAPTPAAAPAATAPARTAASDAVRAHFARQEAQLLARGLMRTDDGSADAPVSASILVRNFERIAL